MIVQDDSVCLVMDLMDTDLARMINSGSSFTSGQVQLFVYQILRGLKALHSASVVHRDLVRPSAAFMHPLSLHHALVPMPPRPAHLWD